jgi:hypothetical protein
VSDQTEAFVKGIVERFPKLSPLLQEHLHDNRGELLPHLFFGDLTRYVVALVTSGDNQLEARRELRELLAFLEESFASGDSELCELISVSFLENLPYPWEDGSQLRSMLGPTLSTELSRKG